MTIPQAITNGFASSYIAAIYNAKQGLFSGGALGAPKSPIKIKMVSDALYWGYYGGAQTDASLFSVAKYLQWLSGKFWLEAGNITGSGGGVTPITPGSLTINALDFIVSVSSTIAAGETSKTLSQFIGYDVNFFRGGAAQYTTDPGDGSTYYSWNSVTGLFSISAAAQLGEQFRISPTV